MKKRFLAALVCVIMTVGLLPATALADETYTLHYDSGDGQLHIGGSGGAVYTGNAGKWSGSGSTLTLSDFHFTTTASIAMTLSAGTTLVLNGTNTVTSTFAGSKDTNNGTASLGIWTGYGTLTVSGTGSLTATGGKTFNSYSSGVEVLAGNIVVSSGTLSGVASDAPVSQLYGGQSMGIRANSITVTGGRLDGTGASARTSRGVNSSAGDIAVSGNGVVYGQGGPSHNGTNKSIGVESQGGVYVSGNGALTGVGGTADSDWIQDHAYSCGVECHTGSIVVSGGTLAGTGSQASNIGPAYRSTSGSYGVRTDTQAIIVSDGQLTANAESTMGECKALGRELTLQNGMTAQGSATSDGANPAAYVAADTSSYKWVQTVTPVRYPVTLNLALDGAPYAGQTVTMQEGADAAYTYTMTEGAGGAYTHAAVPNGTYTIYKGGVSTGETVAVNNAAGNANLNFFTVSFDANGGAPAPAAQSVIGNGFVAAPDAMTNGAYVFGGWYVDPEMNNAWIFDASQVTEAMTLYAKWMSAPPIPETGDSSRPGLWLGLLLLAGAGLAGSALLGRRRRGKTNA